MSNRFSSRAVLPRRAAGLFILTSIVATSLVTGGCVDHLQIGDEYGEGGGRGTSTGTGGASNNDSTTVTGTGGASNNDSTTVTGTGGASNDEGTTVTGTGGGGSGEPRPRAIALFNEQITTVTDSVKQLWLDTGEVLEPETLILVLNQSPNEARPCGDPVVEWLSPRQPSWNQTLIGLPPSLQKVGKYDISSTDVIAFHSEYVSVMGDGGGGERVLTEGTIEVLSIDDTAVTVHLSSEIFGLLTEEDYEVLRCP